jgi:hypothetical protein
MTKIQNPVGKAIQINITDSGGYYTGTEVETALTEVLLISGSRALTGNWDAGSFEIRAQTFESDVTTGTAPLTITSTTLVSNLNADLLDSQEGSYYLDSANFTGTNWVDLTDSGATTLHKHDHGGQDGLTDDDHTQYILADGTRALTANWDAGSFTITAAGVLVDTTAGFDVNPGSDIDADLLTVGVTGTPKLIWDESADQFSLTNGLRLIAGAGSLPAFNGNEVLIVQSNAADSDYVGITLIGGAATGGSFIDFGDVNDKNVGGIVYRHLTNHMEFSVNAAEAMRIDSSGKVGIGAAPGSDLYVYSTSQYAPVITARNDFATGGIPYLVMENSRSGGSLSNWDTMGITQFKGYNSASESIAAATITGWMVDVTDGTEDAALEIKIHKNGTGRSLLYFGPTETVFNDHSIDQNFRIEGAANANCFFLDAGNDNITINATAVSVNYDLMLAGDGVLGLKETTTPTADTNYGKVYTKNDNKLYFQDGAGSEHEVAFV